MIKGSWGTIFEADMSGTLARNPAVPVVVLSYLLSFITSSCLHILKFCDKTKYAHCLRS